MLRRVSTRWHFGLGFILVPMGWAGEVWWEVDPSWADPSYLYRRQRLGDQHFYVNKWLWKAFFHQSTPPSFPFFLPPHLPSFSLFCPLSFSLSSFLLTQKHISWTVWKFFWEVGSRQVIPFSLPLGCHQLCILKTIDKLMNSGMLLKEPCPMSLERKVLTASQPLNPWPLQ